MIVNIALMQWPKVQVSKYMNTSLRQGVACLAPTSPIDSEDFQYPSHLAIAVLHNPST